MKQGLYIPLTRQGRTCHMSSCKLEVDTGTSGYDLRKHYEATEGGLLVWSSVHDGISSQRVPYTPHVDRGTWRECFASHLLREGCSLHERWVRI
jgi:hypothetical protein